MDYATDVCVDVGYTGGGHFILRNDSDVNSPWGNNALECFRLVSRVARSKVVSVGHKNLNPETPSEHRGCGCAGLWGPLAVLVDLVNLRESIPSIKHSKW